MNKTFWKATAIRLIRTFLTTILGVYTADTLITDVDWKAALLAAFSATVYILILCIISGLPEVELKNSQYMSFDAPHDSEVDEDENE